MKAEHLVGLIIVPALQLIDKLTPGAIALLAGTCAQETNCGQYLIQTYWNYSTNTDTFEGGLGIFQMQKNAHADICTRYLGNNPSLLAKITKAHGPIDFRKLTYNLEYAAIMTRLYYLQKPGSIPDYQDINGLATYYKNWYNTNQGKATIADFVKNYATVKPAVDSYVRWHGA